MKKNLFPVFAPAAFLSLKKEKEILVQFTTRQIASQSPTQGVEGQMESGHFIGRCALYIVPDLLIAAC